jgi:microcystin-dependent protein
MSEPFLGQISMFSFNFPPKGWALCNGQTLPIQQNQALFAILGTTYGGNGQTTFQLPNLQSRTLISMGQGPALTPRNLGEIGGVEAHALTFNELPLHNHNLLAAAGTTTGTPAVTSDFAAQATVPVYRNGSATTALAPTSIVANGANLPHPNIQPCLTVSFCIALVGTFPSRN